MLPAPTGLQREPSMPANTCAFIVLAVSVTVLGWVSNGALADAPALLLPAIFAAAGGALASLGAIVRQT